MAVEEHFLTETLGSGRQGFRIEKATYDVVRGAILENLRIHGSMTFTQLSDLIEEQLQEDFDGMVMWCFTTVKLDMEARGEIRRVPYSRPQKIELCMR